MSAKIAGVEAIAIAVPLREVTSISWFATIDRREAVLVRVRTEDGLEGVGEAVTTPYFTGETARGAADLVTNYFAPAIVGLDCLDLAVAAGRLIQLAPDAPAARSAVEVALHDLAARSLDLPLCDLLGGRIHDRLPATAHLFSPEIDVVCEQARSAVDHGYRILKVKVGRHHYRKELERLGAIHRAAGDDVRIYVDANGVWRPHEATAFAEGAIAVGVELVEQPVAKSDLPGMAAVARVPGVAVAPDEGVRDAADVLAHARHRAADAIVLKLIKSGGFRGARDVLAVAAAADIGVYIAGMPGETSIATAAGIHLALATPELPFGVGVGSHYISQDIVRVPVSPVDGYFAPLTGPGLGVELDEEAVAACRLPPS
jgi:muconate cycloisomerase